MNEYLFHCYERLTNLKAAAAFGSVAASTWAFEVGLDIDIVKRHRGSVHCVKCVWVDKNFKDSNSIPYSPAHEESLLNHNKRRV